MAVIKKRGYNKYCQDAEKLEPSQTSGKNIRRYSYFGKLLEMFLKR
jgi:hypothetical protein